jgi:hypothetical protein
MALPPAPINVTDNSSFVWLEWYRKLRDYLNTSGNVPWAVVNKSGSNLTDINTRAHNSLQTIQGGTAGSYYHLTRILTGNTTFDFPNIGAVNTSTTTVTVTGAQTGDSVIVNPSTALEAGLVVYAYVSAGDTVTIVANNPTAGAINPASRTYYVTVLKA